MHIETHTLNANHASDFKNKYSICVWLAFYLLDGTKNGRGHNGWCLKNPLNNWPTG